MQTLENDIFPNTKNKIELDRREIEAAFQFFDVHRRKKLTPKDLKMRLSAFYPHLSNKEYKFLVSEPDFTVDTLAGILEHNTLRDFDPIRDAFKVFDPHNTGYIDKHTLKKVMQRLGYGQITAEDMAVLIETADVDGDGMISFEDFQNMTLLDMGTIERSRNQTEMMGRKAGSPHLNLNVGPASPSTLTVGSMDTPQTPTTPQSPMNEDDEEVDTFE